MTKVAMIAFLTTSIEELRQRYRVQSNTLVRGRMKRDGETLAAIRKAIETHVPADVPPPEQRELKGVG